MQSNSAKPFLVSPRLDIWILGGLYFAILLPIYFICGRSRETPEYAQLLLILGTLAYAVNYPHFIVSYQLLYIDHKKKLTNNWRFIWAAWISPVLILLALVAAFSSNTSLTMRALISVMGFLGGWHYSKQTFGALIVNSVQKGTPFDKTQRLALKANLLTVWIGGWLYSTANYLGPPFVAGIKVYPLRFPHWLGYVGLSATILSFFWLAWAFRNRFNKNPRNHLSELAIYATGPAWVFPLLATPAFNLMIPLFHCLQYFAFVIAFRRNKAMYELGHFPQTKKDRFQIAGKVWGYILISIVLGWAVYSLIPEALDRNFQFAVLGASPFVAAINIFTNLHHYVIDSVIWKGADADVRTYLFGIHPQPQGTMKKSA